MTENSVSTFKLLDGKYLTRMRKRSALIKGTGIHLSIHLLSHLALVSVHVSSGLQVMMPWPWSRKPSLHLMDTF